MSSFDVSIILRLVDRLTGPARQAAGAMRQLSNNVKKAATVVRSTSNGMEGPFIAALNRMGRKATEFGIRVRHAFAQIARGPGSKLAQTGQALNQQRWQMMGTLFFASPAMLPFKQLADAELELTKIGQISQWKPAEFGQNLMRMNDTLRGVADETKQSFTTIAQGMNFLVASGLPENDSVNGIRSIGKAATATHAEIEDLSKMAYALRQNLDIPPQLWEKAFGKGHLGGKLGAFELKDMAKWFPELTTDMRFLGQAGMGALEDLVAFLQIVRQGAGTPDIAANNLANVFQKIFTKETAKNFQKYAGIDFKKEMMAARDRGENPLFKLLELIDQYAKGEAFQIGDLFVDRQALNAIKILIAKRAEMMKMQSDIRTGDGQLQIDRDSASSLQALTYKARALFVALDKFSNTAFTQVLGETKGVLETLTGYIEKLTALTKANPKLVGTGLLSVGGLFGIALGLRVLIFTFMTFRAAILGATIALRTFWSVLAASAALVGLGPGAALSRLAAGFRLLGAAIIGGGVIGRLAMVRAGFLLLGGALLRLISGPIGWIALALYTLVPTEWWTAAGNLLTQGFEHIKGLVVAFVDDIKGKIAGMWDGLMSPFAGGAGSDFGAAPIPKGGGFDDQGVWQPGSGPATIPDIMSKAAASTPSIENDNRVTTNNISVPVTIHATVNNTTPQGIAGAVQGAGQSVASEVKKALSDGGQ